MTAVGKPDAKRKQKRGAGEEDESDIESVASDEFDQLLSKYDSVIFLGLSDRFLLLAKFEPGAKNDDFEIDFTK